MQTRRGVRLAAEGAWDGETNEAWMRKVSFSSPITLSLKGREQEMGLDCLYRSPQDDCLICATVQRVGCGRMRDERHGLH